MEERVILRTRCGCKKVVSTDARMVEVRIAIAYNRPSINYETMQFSSERLFTAEERRFEFRGERIRGMRVMEEV